MSAITEREKPMSATKDGGRDRVRLSLDVSPELYEKLGRIADELHGSKSEVLRKAIVLMEVALRGKEQGLRLGLARPDQPLTTEIVGL